MRYLNKIDLKADVITCPKGMILRRESSWGGTMDEFKSINCTFKVIVSKLFIRRGVWSITWRSDYKIGPKTRNLLESRLAPFATYFNKKNKCSPWTYSNNGYLQCRKRNIQEIMNIIVTFFDKTRRPKNKISHIEDTDNIFA